MHIFGYEIGEKGYKLWDPVAKKKVVGKDVIFDEAFMLNQNKEKTMGTNKMVIEVEFDEHNILSDMGDIDTNSQQQQQQEQQEEPYTIAKGRGKRKHKTPFRYDFDDIVSFALVTRS